MKKQQAVTTVAEEILIQLGKPIHYKKLTSLLLERCQLTGNTPHETVRSRLATSPKFKRVAEGVFALSIWSEYPAIRFGKDIAYDVLTNIGHSIPIDVLGEKIFLERKFTSGPLMIVRNILASDNRFSFDKSSGMVGLVEWGK